MERIYPKGQKLKGQKPKGVVKATYDGVHKPSRNAPYRLDHEESASPPLLPFAAFVVVAATAVIAVP